MTKKLVLVSCFVFACGEILAEGKFELRGPELQPRKGHIAVMLADGQILIDGGAIGSPYEHFCSNCRIDAEVFDPVGNTSSLVGGPRPSRKYHTGTLLADGKVLIAGGLYGPVATPTAEVYDPGTKQFFPLPNMRFPHSRHSAHLLIDGSVLVFGGDYPPEIFDPVMRFWRPLPTSAGGGTFAQSVMLDSSKLFYIGGFFSFPSVMELNGTVKLVGGRSRFWGMEDHSVTRLADGRVLAAGGNEELGGWTYGFFSNSRTVEIFDPESSSLKVMDKLLEPRSRHSANLLMDGIILIAGGNAAYEAPSGSTEIFNPGLGDFVQGPNLSTGRAEHTSLLMRDGTLLVLGGTKHPTKAEVYVPEKLPALLEVLSNEKGAAVHGGSARIVSNEDPAVAGEVIELYVRGLMLAAETPAVSIGGKLAKVLYAGKSGVPDLQQLNVEVPREKWTGGEVSVWVMDQKRVSNRVRISLKQENE